MSDQTATVRRHVGGGPTPTPLSKCMLILDMRERPRKGKTYPCVPPVQKYAKRPRLDRRALELRSAGAAQGAKGAEQEALRKPMNAVSYPVYGAGGRRDVAGAAQGEDESPKLHSEQAVRPRTHPEDHLQHQ